MTINRSKAEVLVDRDQLNSANKQQVAGICVNIFDRIQGLGREKQLLGLACAFSLMAAASDIPEQDVFTAAKNLMVDPMTSSGQGLQFQAMKYHLLTDVFDK